MLLKRAAQIEETALLTTILCNCDCVAVASFHGVTSIGRFPDVGVCLKDGADVKH
jgi:hypothetical protein